MITGHACGDRHDQRCCPADTGGMGGWGFPSATAEVLRPMRSVLATVW